jgi:DNA repair protein RadC
MPDKSIKFKTLEWKFKETTIKYPEYSNIPQKKISSPDDFFIMFNPLLKEESREVFLVVWLSTFNKVVGFEIASAGGLNSSIVDPRAVFRGAIISNCASIIIAHNHPSGNPEPSEEDIKLTKTLVEAGKIIGIKIFDHLIFTDTYTSFVERGLI